ncbi:MAG: tellurite resistance TerB family protein [Desulfobacterales bacterium]|nr:tellurite resistance TerB family protein [Desulfobacterales bacterium]
MVLNKTDAGASDTAFPRWSVGTIEKKPEEAKLMVRVCCAIGAADGNFDDTEKQIVRDICAELGLNPKDFNLV